MSIATKLTKLETDITNAYSAINTKSGTIPQNKNTENLATAINSIPTGGSTPTGTINIATNGTYDVTNYATANVNIHGTNYRLFEGQVTTETSSATDYQQIFTQNEIPQEFLDHWQDDNFGIILLRDNITSNITTGNWCLSQKVGNNQAVAGSNGSIYRITNGSANSVQSSYQFKNYHTYDNPQFNGALCYDSSYGLRLYQKTSSYHHPASHWVMIMFW